jgi:hypothetical protein
MESKIIINQKNFLLVFSIILLTGCTLFAATVDAQDDTLPNEGFSTEQIQQDRKWVGHIQYLIGYKGLSGDWAPAENQFEFGLLDFDFRRVHWPISIVAQLLLSYASDVPDQPGFRGDFSGTYEFNLGLRKVWESSPRFHPFLGGGFSIVGGSTTEQHNGPGGAWYNQEDNDSGLGFWVGTGAYWIFAKSFHTGINAQYTWGEIELFGNDLDTGGIHLNAIIGFHW